MVKATPETTIAHYRIMEPIGAGGMGAVFKAYDKKLHRVIALKLLPAQYLSQQDRRRRFLQEARAASALNHPHILTVYDVGEEDGKPYIAMEYVQGDTLRKKIEARTLTIRETLNIAIQISEGLAKAHELGIIHRDLKPENLMISRDGYAKILDFGLAKLVAQRERALAADSEQKTLIRVNTESGTLLGTVNSTSPEQLLGHRVDRRCDIFSLGVVLCEMITGSSPFVHENRIDTMHAILHRPPRLPEADNGEVPAAILPILTKALAKIPKERYQTVNELAADLRALKRDLELGVTLPVPAGSRLVLKRTLVSRTRGINYEAELNEAQLKAVLTTEGPLLIVAGAGTGKTRTLVYRVARLVEIGAKPESVLLLTFTRRAATSMLTRAASLADARCQRVSGGTFHSVGHSILRKYAELAGLQRNFTVLDQSDTEELIYLLRPQLRLTRDRHFPRKRTIAAIYSMMVNKVVSLKQVLNQSYPQFV